MHWLKGTACATLVLASAAMPGFAASSVVSNRAAYEHAVDLYHSVLKARAPGLVEPLAAYPADVTPAVVCEPGRLPRTHAILVGVNDVGEEARTKLEAPENDVALIATVLKDRGVAPERVHVLLGKNARRQPLADAFRHVLADSGCGDRIVVQVAGHAVEAEGLAMGVLLRAKDRVSAQDFEAYFTEEAVRETFHRLRRQLVRTQAEWAGLQLAVDSDLALLLNDEVKGYHEVVRGRDLSDFVTAARNKGAHPAIILDVAGSTLAAIESRQRQAGDQTTWSFEFRGGRNNYWPAPGLIPGHGGFTVFYASGGAETTPELPWPKGSPDARRYGLFSFVIYGGILGEPAATARSISQEIERYYTERGAVRPHPRVESTEPDAPLIAEVQPRTNDDPIKILNPAPKRGAAVMEKAEIDVEGVVDWSAPVLGVVVGNGEAKLTPGGRFSRTVQLKPGMNVVNIIAATAEPRMHTKTLEFLFEGDKKALEGEGRRYAVIIANQNYGKSTGMPSLSTPVADAEALQAVLSRKYGFVTELQLPGARKLPLLLKDATKREIEVALFQLGKVAGTKDTVLIFYAGHGVFEPVTSIAYWVPSDAEVGFEPSYLSAADISAAIQRIQADHVILISDSCYSGALLRGGQPREEKVDENERMRALLKLQSHRSRIVITSGNNEPVADLGGGEHSIFARALLTGLDKMEHDAFSARELFDGYILRQVTANADQEPQYRPLDKVGHEGGDFVFVKVAPGP